MCTFLVQWDVVDENGAVVGFKDKWVPSLKAANNLMKYLNKFPYCANVFITSSMEEYYSL